MNIHDLVLAYKQGERLYRGTLSRHFGYEQGGKYLKELVESGMFKEEKLYKCPNCDFPLFSSNQEEAEYYLSQKEMFCYACDTEIKVSELYEEPLLIRTDKPVCSVTIEEDRIERCKGCEHAVVAPLEEAGDPPDLLYCTEMGYPCDMIKLCDVKNTEIVNNEIRSLTDKEAEIYNSWLEAESIEVQPIDNGINVEDRIKQYLKELITIVDSFGLDNIYKCGRINNACKYCKYFNEKINHAVCSDDDHFIWKHYIEAKESVEC